MKEAANWLRIRTSEGSFEYGKEPLSLMKYLLFLE
jgi:hypothetical protein